MIKEIDVKTKQVLIEAFIVDVTSSFAKALGTRIGAMSKKGTSGEAGSEIMVFPTACVPCIKISSKNIIQQKWR